MSGYAPTGSHRAIGEKPRDPRARAARGAPGEERFLDCATRRPTNRGARKSRVASLGMTVGVGAHVRGGKAIAVQFKERGRGSRCATGGLHGVLQVRIPMHPCESW